MTRLRVKCRCSWKMWKSTASLHNGPTHSPDVAVLIRQAFCPSVFYVKGLDAITHIVLECWVANRHALLTPFQSLFIDGLHRVNRPAGQVSEQFKKKTKKHWIYDLHWDLSRQRGNNETQTFKQTVMYTSPVKLWLGPFWDMAFWKFRSVVRK